MAAGGVGVEVGGAGLKHLYKNLRAVAEFSTVSMQICLLR